MQESGVSLAGNQNSKDILRALTLLESAVEGADMGDPALKDALCTELIEVIEAYKAQHAVPLAAT